MQYFLNNILDSEETKECIAFNEHKTLILKHLIKLDDPYQSFKTDTAQMTHRSMWACK
jgi:hypothetical protein